MRVVQILLALLPFVAAISVATLGAVGALDDLGQAGELLQDGRWGLVAALIMVGIFAAGVWPQLRQTFLGDEVVRARRIARELNAATILVNGHQCSGGWLLLSSVGDHLMDGVDSWGTPTAIPEIDQNLASGSGLNDWVEIKRLLFEHGLITVTQLAPVGNHSREMWRLTVPIAQDVRGALRAMEIKEPRSVYDGGEQS